MRPKRHRNISVSICLVLVSVYLFPLEAGGMRNSVEAEAVSGRDSGVYDSTYQLMRMIMTTGGMVVKMKTIRNTSCLRH